MSSGGIGTIANVAETSVGVAMLASDSKDVSALITPSGCDGDPVKRIYSNLKASMTGAAPEVTEAEQESQARAAEEVAIEAA